MHAILCCLAFSIYYFATQFRLLEWTEFIPLCGRKVVCCAWHGGLCWKPPYAAVCFFIFIYLFFFKKRGHRTISLVPHIWRLADKQMEERNKNNSWLLMWKVSAHTSKPPNARLPLVSGDLSSYVTSLHEGKPWLRRILEQANAESHWQTLAAMISSLIICTACCGRRPARPANRRAQEGRREHVIASAGSGPALSEDANINRVYQALISRKMQMPFLWAVNLN